MARSLRSPLAALIVLAVTAATAHAQEPPTAPLLAPHVPSASGREFWLAFQKNFRAFVIDERTQAVIPSAELSLGLFIVADASTTGLVEVPGIDFHKEFTLAPGRVTYIEIPNEAEVTGSGYIEDRGVHVVADQPVTVYALNRRYQSTDTYLAIPVDALGRAYRGLGYRVVQKDLISQLAVVATEDNTVVFIHPTTKISDQRPVLENNSETVAKRLERIRYVGSRRFDDTVTVRLPVDTPRVDTREMFSYEAFRRTIIVPSIRTRGKIKRATAVAEVTFTENVVDDVWIAFSDKPEYDRFIVDALKKFRYPVLGIQRIAIDVSPDNFGGKPRAADREVAEKKAATAVRTQNMRSPRVTVKLRERSADVGLQDTVDDRARDAMTFRTTPNKAEAEIQDVAQTEVLAAPLPPSGPIKVTLHAGDVYQIIPQPLEIPGRVVHSESDLTGTLVTSSKPVAVFSGHNCAQVPTVTTKACNILAEQLPPTSSWGRTFVLGTLEGRSQSVMRVVARDDSTIVSVNGREVGTLDAGKFYENIDLRDNAIVTTSRPALVAQYSPGFDNGDNVGDPMMIVVPPAEQFDNVYVIATPVRGSWHHYVNVVVRSEQIENLRIDTHPVDQTRFSVLGASGYSVGRLEITFGSHVVTGAAPFGLYQYGFGYEESAYDAYGNAGGQTYIDLDSIEQNESSGEAKPDIGLLHE